jgi:hypothetical protein
LGPDGVYHSLHLFLAVLLGHSLSLPPYSLDRLPYFSGWLPSSLEERPSLFG